MRRMKWATFFSLLVIGLFLLGQSGSSPQAQVKRGYSVRAFRVEIEGAGQKGIVQILEFTPYRSGLRGLPDNQAMALQRVFTRYVTPPFKIVRVVDYDETSRLNQWVQDSIRARNSGVDPATRARNLDIILLKGAEEKLTFHVKNAWIAEITYSDFDRAAAGELKETLVIESQSIVPML